MYGYFQSNGWYQFLLLCLPTSPILSRIPFALPSLLFSPFSTFFLALPIAKNQRRFRCSPIVQCVALWRNVFLVIPVSVLTFSCNSVLHGTFVGAMTTKMTLNQPNCSAYLMGGAQTISTDKLSHFGYLSAVNRAFYFRFGAVYSHCSSLGPRTLCMHTHTHTEHSTHRP